jgi:hypothetical protein
LLQRLGLLCQLRRLSAAAQNSRQRRTGPAGGIDIALDLAQSNRAPGQRAVPVEDGIVGVFPALVEQTIARLAVILHEAVTVPVPIAVDPQERRLQVRPEGLHEDPVPAPLVVGACQQDEQRRGVHTAVVAAEGHLFQDGHLAVAGLVQDLAGLCVLFWDDLRGLGRGQVC